MFIQRQLAEKARQLFTHFPALMITGPRQSGKTTLIRELFPDLPYATLEDTDVRRLALADPRHFLQNFPNGAVLDEVQRTPELFSFLQGIIDSKPDIRFVLSGSQNFLLMEQVSQSLAGRVAVLRLLPFSMSEMKNGGLPIPSLEEVIFNGGYPRILTQGFKPPDFFTSYLETYLERDVRQLRQIGNLEQFTRFIRLCAGRVGQLLNASSLATDAGISTHTAQSWLSVLQAGHLIFLLSPHYQNFNKRLVKMPKLYFTDTGLACNLLGLETPRQLTTHFAKGPLFENLVLLELLKKRFGEGKSSNLYFWRDNHGHEIDGLIESPERLLPLEIKSGSTMNMGWFDGLNYWNKLAGQTDPLAGCVVHGGDTSVGTSFGRLVSWRDLDSISAF